MLLKDTELFSKLKSNILPPVFILFGKEGYFVQKAVDEIIRKTVEPSFEGFNLARLEGEKLSLQELEDACELLPVMAEKRAVVVKDFPFEGLNKDDLKTLTELLKNPNESTVLVFYSTDENLDFKKAGKLKKAVDALGDRGFACEFALKDKLTLKRALCAKAREAYVEMDMETAEYLIDCCSLQYSVLLNELEKLVAFTNGGEITKEAVDACVIKSINASAFDLAKAILSGNFEKAYLLVDDLFSSRQEAIMILSALSSAFLDIYRAKCGIAEGKSQADIADDFSYPKNRSFAVQNAMKTARSFSIKQIRKCVDALYEADLELKSSKLEDRLVLEKTVGKMMLYREGTEV